ncbi:hypothetical protein [Kitasatospora sp. NPDC002040]|uniref:hypothetical protein n=1 Tax=Kitasatospora sp. NPDC002040 TaxID=3154661 RepID=UPI00332EE69B
MADELDLLAGLPVEEAEIRWALARWRLTLIVKGAIHPATGAGLLGREVWAPLGYPSALHTIAGDAAEYENWIPAFHDSLETIAARIVAEATRLVTAHLTHTHRFESPTLLSGPEAWTRGHARNQSVRPGSNRRRPVA